MGLEPTTFTLATCEATDANQRDSNELRSSDDPARSALDEAAAPQGGWAERL
jgi:hypothetical protein